MTPLVSIIIPAFDAEPWIGAAITSATAQTHRALEVIVIDDGSRDATLARAREAASGDARVSVHTQSNAGAAAARNHGLRLARGKFVQFLDADDLLAPEKIARQLADLARAPVGALGLGRWGRFHDSPERAVFAEESIYAARNGIEYLALHYEGGGMAQPAAWLAPRALLDAAGPWDERLSLNDDGEYFARVALRAPAIVTTPEARSFYRTSGTAQLSRRRDARALASLFLSVELTLGHLLAAENSPRTRAAAAYAWKLLALELWPDDRTRSHQAEARSRALGGSARPLPGGRFFRWFSPLIGWRLARQLSR